MALEVVSSILVARPTLMGCSQEVKAPDFDSGITLVQIQPPQPRGPLAQLAEHLTFNQGVPSSNLGWTTTKKAALLSALRFSAIWTFSSVGRAIDS